MIKLTNNYFYGNEISEYGQKHGFLDYRTLAKSFDAVLSNDIIPRTEGLIGWWEQVSGFNTDDDDAEQEIYQYYIVDDNGAEILQECEEIVFYNDELGLYVWGVTHYGTSWDYVLTNVPCNVAEED